jgi:hypothetical protein
MTKAVGNDYHLFAKLRGLCYRESILIAILVALRAGKGAAEKLTQKSLPDQQRAAKVRSLNCVFLSVGNLSKFSAKN